VNTQGEITSWNRAADVSLGRTARQAVGRTLALLIPPGRRARHVGAFRAAMEAASSPAAAARPTSRP
jgi:PAS domain S-box-containing protein